MADTEPQAETVSANDAYSGSIMAAQLQLLLRRIGHPTEALDYASDVAVADEDARQALDRVSSFSRLISDQADEGVTLANKIEEWSLRKGVRSGRE